MILRAVFLADGPSDLPLGTHLSELCQERGLDVRITAPDPTRFPSACRTVEDRLSLLQRSGDPIDVAFIHRDAESQTLETRCEEIAAAIRKTEYSGHVVPIVPVRMTEAWLLLDDAAIRTIAGRPSGTEPLDLPQWKKAESIPDPKKLLKHALATASGTTGRRRQQFTRDFGRHRRMLLTNLDRSGPVKHLSSWNRLLANLDELAKSVSADGQTPPPTSPDSSRAVLS